METEWEMNEMVNGGAEQEWACTYKPTVGSGRHTQAPRPNSACLYSAAHLALLTSERTRFTQGSKVMSSPSGGLNVCVVMGEFVQAQCLHISYISSPHCVCAPLLVCVREDSPLRWLQFHTGQGGGGWQRTRDYKGKTQGQLQFALISALRNI